MPMIQVDLNRLRSDTQQLYDLLQNYCGQLKKLEETEQTLNTMWCGTAHDGFDKMFAESVAQMTRFAEAVDRFAVSAQEAQKRYARAEMKATAIASDAVQICEAVGYWRIGSILGPGGGLSINIFANLWNAFHTDGEILVEPDKLRETAAVFGAEAGTVQGITQAMTELVCAMSAYWMGDAASMFLTKFGGLRDDIEKIVCMIEKFSTDLQEIAQNYVTAERQNLSDFEGLASDVIL